MPRRMKKVGNSKTSIDEVSIPEPIRWKRMPVETCNFYDPLEPFIYWDSSFSIAASDEDHKCHLIYKKFADRCTSENSICLISDWVLNEVAFYIIRTNPEVLGRQQGLYWRELLRRNPSVIDTILPKVRAAFAELYAFTLWLPSLNKRFYDLLQQRRFPAEQAIQAVAGIAWSTSAMLSDEVLQLMERCRLLSTDACYIVVAQSSRNQRLRNP